MCSHAETEGKIQALLTNPNQHDCGSPINVHFSLYGSFQGEDDDSDLYLYTIFQGTQGTLHDQRRDLTFIGGQRHKESLE